MGTLHGRQMTYKKSPPVLGFFCFVGHIVIDLNYLKKLIYVILNSYTVGCRPRRLARDLNFQKNDPQTLKTLVTI